MPTHESKKVVVTGGSGFLGSRVVAQLKKAGYEDIVVPRSATCDLREQSNVRNFLKTEKPDIIIHLAAVVGGIGANRDNPGKYFYDNLMMGVVLMEEARLSG